MARCALLALLVLTMFSSTAQAGTWSAPQLLAPPFPATGVSRPAPPLSLAVSGGGTSATFNGATWSTPAPAGAGFLTAVSCASATLCAAAGANGSLVTFNGTSWATPATPGGNFGFVSVSCPSPVFCVATNNLGQASQFNGTTWSAH